tara:strand:+ start:1425 stop:2279 length:855 start_codon:yes stop_codon:yes gene_type:complete
MSSLVTEWSVDTSTSASETTSTALNNATLSGTLAVTGATALNGGINAALTLSNTLTVTGATTLSSTLTVGSDSSGHDVIFYGALSGRDLVWDESQYRLRANDNAQITVGTGNDCTLSHNGSETLFSAVGDLTIGVSSGTLYLGSPQEAGVPISIGHTTSEVTINDNLTVTGALVGTRLAVTNLADDGSIPITATCVSIDANGGARTGIRFTGGGVAGQILTVNNTGGEALTFHNTEGTALVRGIHADHDTMEANFMGMFVSDGTYWNLIAGGVDSQPDVGLTAS